LGQQQARANDEDGGVVMAQEPFHVESQVEDVEVGVGLLQVYVGEVSVEVAYWWVGVGNKNIPRALMQKTGLKCSAHGLRTLSSQVT